MVTGILLRSTGLLKDKLDCVGSAWTKDGGKGAGGKIYFLEMGKRLPPQYLRINF